MNKLLTVSVYPVSLFYFFPEKTLLLYSAGTLRLLLLPILRQPIHMSVSSIWLQVWAMKSLCLAATASFRQVELLQFFSS